MLLLDTNALSEVVKRRPQPGFLRRLKEHDAEIMLVAAVSVLELRHGCRRHPTGEQLWERITRDLLSRVTVVPFGETEAVRAGELLADLEAQGQVIDLEDLMIGATALVRGASVVSRNVRHLERVPGLRVLDWWR